MIDPHAVLHCEMDPLDNDARAHTVGEFLGVLLETLWVEADGFSGKRPLGNSDWQYQVYEALVKAELIPGVFDEDGYLDDVDDEAADELILNAIRFTYDHA